MKRFLVVCALALAATVASTENAAAQGPGAYSFLPFGFYQPYGAFYKNNIPTPPYFATNPPVYYGARHSRPYGLSPFASPPLVNADNNYESRLRTQFMQPQIPTPGPQSRAPICNPCFGNSLSSTNSSKTGKIQTNPFVKPEDLIAKN